jgi:hypothetical protein
LGAFDPFSVVHVGPNLYHKQPLGARGNKTGGDGYDGRCYTIDQPDLLH